MQLSEEQIRAIWDETVFDQTDKGRTAWEAVRQQAPRAIAEKLKEGIVWEAEAEAYETRTGYSVGLDWATWTPTSYLPSAALRDSLAERQLVTVTVSKKEEGEDAAE